MSLWTPGGEHPVDREPAPAEDELAAPEHDEDPLAGLTPEERERAIAMAAEMDEVRRQLASTPAAVVVANHVMGLYELGAIHLSADPPNFAEAQVAIDAMGAIVETLRGRLGENEPTLTDALGQLRLAFVQLRGSASGADASTESTASDDS
jgi:uncharacterized protein with GYD domain